MEPTIAGLTKSDWLAWAESKPGELKAELLLLIEHAFHDVEGEREVEE